MLCQISVSKSDWVAENLEHSGRLIVPNTLAGRVWNLTRLPEDQENRPEPAGHIQYITAVTDSAGLRSAVPAPAFGWCGWAAQTKHTLTRTSGAKHLQLQLLHAWKHVWDLEKSACNGAADITEIPEKPAACPNTSTTDTEKHDHVKNVWKDWSLRIQISDVLMKTSAIHKSLLQKLNTEIKVRICWF